MDLLVGLMEHYILLVYDRICCFSLLYYCVFKLSHAAVERLIFSSVTSITFIIALLTIYLLVSETTLALLRHPDYCISGYSSVSSKS